MADDIKESQTQDPMLPPLAYSDNDADHQEPYDKINAGIPLEQPLLFYMGHQKAFYLPKAQTDDESDHLVPQNIYNPATKARILPVAYLRQGEASSFAIHMHVWDESGPADLSKYKMFSVRGYDSQWHLISTDEGLDTTNANIGEIDWKPEEAVALTAGKYHTVQLVIESEDRVTRAITLDFDLHIIPNNVAFPRPMAFYISEMQRALFNIGELTAAAYKHTGYMINFLDQVVMDALDNYKKKIDTTLADFENQIGEKQKKLDELGTNLDTLGGKESDFETTLNTSLADLKAQINQANLITKDNLKTEVISLISNGDINVDDSITADAQAVIDDWNKEDNNG